MLEDRDFSEVMASKLASVGIDVCKGITYTGSEDKYIKALQTFCSVYAVHSKALVE